jgi:transcriptional regulator with XRE-family HTH domain
MLSMSIGLLSMSFFVDTDKEICHNAIPLSRTSTSSTPMAQAKKKTATAAGDNAVTMEDLARMAGVSSITVSRALRDSPLVTDKTREKIRRIAAEQGYRFNISARNLRMRRSYSVAVVVEMTPVKGRPMSDPVSARTAGRDHPGTDHRRLQRRADLAPAARHRAGAGRRRPDPAGPGLARRGGARAAADQRAAGGVGRAGTG